jgi:predicted MFS family arabinose efflux permease
VPSLAVLLCLATAPGAIGLSYNYLLPAASEQLGVGSDGLGILLACAGAGGLVAGLVADAFMRRIGHGRAIFAGLATISGGLVLFGISPSLPAAALSMVVCGAGFLVYGSSSLSLIQALSAAEFRGRLTALFALLYWGLMPIGALVGGAAAEVIGAQQTTVVAGALIAAAGMVALVARPGIAAERVGSDGHAD